MCGIAGCIDHSSKEIPHKLSNVPAHMAETMYSRDPDHGGAWADERNGLALSHRRFAIIDLSPSGHQSMFPTDRRYVITYNREIYNFLEIKKALEEKGHSFSSSCDTEVLLQACVAWGVKKAIEQ